MGALIESDLPRRLSNLSPLIHNPEFCAQASMSTKRYEISEGRLTMLPLGMLFLLAELSCQVQERHRIEAPPMDNRLGCSELNPSPSMGRCRLLFLSLEITDRMTENAHPPATVTFSLLISLLITIQ